MKPTITLQTVVTITVATDALQRNEDDLKAMLEDAPPEMHNIIIAEHTALSDDELRTMNINGVVAATLKHLHDASGVTLPMLVDGTDFFIEQGRPLAIVAAHVRVEEVT